MKIHEKIRRYRKAQNLTQEDVANYLGVTAPAVNKWENAVSYPDITLLAPLARLLNIDVNELLSFREELTDQEIGKIIEELNRESADGDYEAAFEKAAGLIREYPSCDKLTLQLAMVLNMYLPLQKPEIREKYEPQVWAWLETVAAGPDRTLADSALFLLCRQQMDAGRWEEAGQLLERIPPQGLDKRLMQINVFYGQKRTDEAFQLCEALIYQSANSLIGNLSKLCQLLCEEQEYEKARRYAALAQQAAEAFELGSYIAGSAQLSVETSCQDKEKALSLLESMVQDINMDTVRNSSLYPHLNFREGDWNAGLKVMLRKGLEEDDQLEFIRGDSRFRRIMERLEG